MLNMRLVIVGFLCVAAVGADAQSFEQQLFQFSQHAAATARQSREDFQALSATTVGAQSQTAWQKVTGPDGTFTVEMPEAPKYTTAQAALSGSGAAYTVHMYFVETGGRAFIIHTAIYPPGLDISNPRNSLQAGLDNTVKNMTGGKWISVTWTKHQGLTAVEAIGLKNGYEVRSFSVLRGQQLFTLTYGGADGTSRSDDANRFVASLNIR